MNEDAMIYAMPKPDMGMLKTGYDSTVTDLHGYFMECRRSYEHRRNIWAGKSYDLRKHGANAFPWEGASDQEVNLIGERTDQFVALFDQALSRSHIKAFASNSKAVPRQTLVSSFLKWMVKSYIPDFKEEMELAGNHFLEKGLMISYTGWKREKRTVMQSFSLAELNEINPELAAMVQLGDNDDELASMFTQQFEGLPVSRAKKALREMREKGESVIPVPKISVDCPDVKTCAPDMEVLFPSYAGGDYQRAPYVFWRMFYTPQELEKKAATDGWSKKWVKEAIKKLKGHDTVHLDAQNERQRSQTNLRQGDDNELIMVVYTFQRLIDKQTGAEGIYRTVFHPDMISGVDAPEYAVHELMDDMEDYPFVVTSLSRDQRRLYETTNFSKMLRGCQWQMKVERDSRTDRASLTTLPPILHPQGRPPANFGPGRYLSYRKMGEIGFGPTPPNDNGSIEVEAAMTRQADAAIGLDFENPASQARMQFFISKYLRHVEQVLATTWLNYQKYGPDEVFFMVTGSPDPMTMEKGDGTDEYNITVSFDSLNNDPETAKAKVEQMAMLTRGDVTGRLSNDKMVEFLAFTIDPIMAEYVLQPSGDAQKDIAMKVTEDLSKIYSGIEVPAQPNGAQVAIAMIEQYVTQPDVAARLQQDQAFQARLTKYHQQYQFQLDQMQNAQIGRIGTEPAQMGDVQTQQITEQ